MLPHENMSALLKATPNLAEQLMEQASNETINPIHVSKKEDSLLTSDIEERFCSALKNYQNSWFRVEPRRKEAIAQILECMKKTPRGEDASRFKQIGYIVNEVIQGDVTENPNRLKSLHMSGESRFMNLMKLWLPLIQALEVKKEVNQVEILTPVNITAPYKRMLFSDRFKKAMQTYNEELVEPTKPKPPQPKTH